MPRIQTLESLRRRIKKIMPRKNDILKMYKLFPKEQNPNNGTIGYCLTKVLLEDGEVWQRITTLNEGCARGKPGGSREREWKGLYQEQIDNNDIYKTLERVKHQWYKQGFIVPKGYWVGPPHLKPNKTTTEKTLEDNTPQQYFSKQQPRQTRQEEPEEILWTPDMLRRKD